MINEQKCVHVRLVPHTDTHTPTNLDSVKTSLLSYADTVPGLAPNDSRKNE